MDLFIVMSLYQIIKHSLGSPISVTLSLTQVLMSLSWSQPYGAQCLSGSALLNFKSSKNSPFLILK